MRDYVGNISLGLPNARHSLTIVDYDESSWTKLQVRPISITLVEGEADSYCYVWDDNIPILRDRLILATRMPSRNRGPT